MSTAYEIPENTYYTYKDYLVWEPRTFAEGTSPRYELHDGEAVMLAAPTDTQQLALTELLVQLHAFLKGKPCKVFPAPFDVRLKPKADNSDDTVFQPDIVVICDSSKISRQGCRGAPDLIVEILSPATAKYDRVYKRHKYREAGVREYWIVDPETQTLETCLLKNGEYVVAAYDDSVPVAIQTLPGCAVDLKPVFAV